MKKTMYKRVLGVFVLAFALVGIINVYAVEQNETSNIEELKGKCEELEKVPREEWTARYAIEEKIDTKGYTISINEDQLPKGLKSKEIQNKMKFKLTEIRYYNDIEVKVIGGNDENPIVEYVYKYLDGSITGNLDSYIIGDNKVLTTTSDVTINKDSLTIPEGGGVEFTFTPIEQFDPILADCEKMRLKAVYVTAEAVSNELDPVEFSYANSDTTGQNIEWTNCDNYQTDYPNKDSFEYKFCYAKEKALAAIASGKTKKYVFKDNSKWPDLIDNTKAGTLNFKCDYKTPIKKPEDTKNYDYYVNKDYLLGEIYLHN